MFQRRCSASQATSSSVPRRPEAGRGASRRGLTKSSVTKKLHYLVATTLRLAEHEIEIALDEGVM